MKWLFVARVGFCAILSAPASLAANRILLRYLPVGDHGFAEALTSDRTGSLFAVTAITDDSGVLRTRVIKTDPNGAELASFDFGFAFQVAAITDADGNLIIAGAADQNNFPLSAPAGGPVSDIAAFVMKLDSELHGIVFTKLFPAPSWANAVVLDENRNIFVGGNTSAQTFPITPGAYQSKSPVPTPFGSQTYAFLTQLSPDGSQILYSTFFGGNDVNCNGGSACVGVLASTSISALTFDTSGAIFMAGSTDATDLTATPGALGGGCACSNEDGAGFIAKFSSGGTPQLVWSAFLNTQNTFYESVDIHAIALDSADNVIVAGAAPFDLPTTAGVVQPALPTSETGGGFIAKVNNLGTSLIWSTYFGNDIVRGVSSIALDQEGNIVLTGFSDPNLLPHSSAPSSGFGCYTAKLSEDATTLLSLSIGSRNACGQSIAINAAGKFTAMGRSGALWIETAGSGGSLLATANAASGPVSGLVAPSELLSLYGSGIGPATPVSGEVENGAFTSSLGGYQVLFDSLAAPMLYAGASQINIIVPREVALQDSTHIQIVSASGTIDGPIFEIRPAEPAVFEGPVGFSSQVLAAALNQDGTPNSEQNPAKPGSIVTIFTTGTGATLWTDGMIVPIGRQAPPSLPISVLYGNASLEVVYAGDAPGLVAGVMQINFRLPTTLPPKLLSLQLEAGGALTGFTIEVP